MIELVPNAMIEWDGFDVYDAEIGDNLFPSDVAEKSFPEDKTLKVLACGFCLGWDGDLYLVCDGGNVRLVPKKGDYLIQINGKKFIRW